MASWSRQVETQINAWHGLKTMPIFTYLALQELCVFQSGYHIISVALIVRLWFTALCRHLVWVPMIPDSVLSSSNTVSSFPYPICLAPNVDAEGEKRICPFLFFLNLARVEWQLDSIISEPAFPWCQTISSVCLAFVCGKSLPDNPQRGRTEIGFGGRILHCSALRLFSSCTPPPRSHRCWIFLCIR